MGPAFSERRSRLLTTMAVAPDCALYVTNPVDVMWLTGFTGVTSSSGQALVSSALEVLITDNRYTERALADCPDIEVYIPPRPPMASLLARLANAGVRTVLVDESVATVASVRRLAELAAEHSMSVEATAFVLPALRMDKDEFEIASLRRACELSDAALEKALAKLHVGMTEKQFAFILETAMVELGADGRAFESIVAAGPHSAIPHHSPTDRPIVKGDLLKVDFGALVAGYHADETRTFVIGEPAAWQVEIHAVVEHAQRTGREALRAGVTLAEVDSAVREVLADAGYLEAFVHGLGHGVGLQIHEEPFFSPTGAGILSAGHAVTIEPGVYLPGKGGVRIEDTLVVRTSDAESLTTTPRDLRVLC